MNTEDHQNEQKVSETSQVNGCDGGYHDNGTNGCVNECCSITFALPEEEGVGDLSDILASLKKRSICLKHIESRPLKVDERYIEYYIDIKNIKTNNQAVVEDVKTKACNVVLHQEDAAPWFPKTISDLDKFADQIRVIEVEKSPEYPEFAGENYVARKKEIMQIALNYRHGEPLQRIEYTAEEIATWDIAFAELTKLYPKYACKEVNEIFPLLREKAGFRLGHIPQIDEVSRFLKEHTGFILRPVAGFLSPRNFLAGLAFRVFHSTQYIRHSKYPLYTPEPDVIHEMLGHVPMFASPSFAQFSQEIGLASLGASDEWIDKLATLYLFTVEFGLCHQNGAIKAYGAGLLSSASELQYCITDKAEHLPFNADKMSVTPYPVSEFQPTYFIGESFEDMKRLVREWTMRIPRPFCVRYNPYAESIDILRTRKQLMGLISDAKYILDISLQAIAHVED